MLTSSELDSLNDYANLYTAEQVRELDRFAIEQEGIPGILLMKRAGQAILDIALDSWPELKTARHKLIIFSGTGNNGGDGYIVAGLAKQKNIDSIIVEVSPDKVKNDAKRARDFALEQGVETVNASEWLKNTPSIDTAINKETVLVDALLGTGFKSELRPLYHQLIKKINQSGQPVISADIPSGLLADTGAVSELAIEADVTVTFIGAKLGLFTGQGRAYCGDIIFDNLDLSSDIYEDIEPTAKILDLDELLEELPQRSLTNHKGSHGHVLIVGGCLNGGLSFGGAPVMAAEAAARVGTGLVSVVTRPEHRAAINARIPEVMVCDATDIQTVNRLLDKATTIVIGPGLGTDAWGQKLLQWVLAAGKPMVVDADALNLIASTNIGKDLDLNGSLITPHPGEASRLLGRATQDVNRDRLASVRQLQQKFGCTVLLKGSGTLISSNADQSDNLKGDNRLFLCPYGNPGMGSGGMGDVLSGVIGGLMAQGMSSNQAAKLGACVHAYAADMLAEKEGLRGILATDLIAEIRRLINEF